MQIVYGPVATVLLGVVACSAQSFDAAEFAKALSAIPTEERYAFAKRLSEWQEPPPPSPATH